MTVAELMLVDGVEVRDIAGFEGLYGIAADGRIWSYRKRCWRRPSTNNCGYAIVGLKLKGVERGLLVHRLVALAWVTNDEPESKREVNHLDGVKLHNSAENLEWSTRRQNLIHAVRTGLRRKSAGEMASVSALGKSTRALTLEQASDVRRRLSNGEFRTDLAANFKVSRSTIADIASGKRYREAR